MPGPIKRLSQFWQELKRRNVIKVVAMYAATAFIILEVVDIITPALLLPTWTITLVIVLLAVGFPITIILSWIFDVTPEGVIKTDTIDFASEHKSESSPTKKGIKTSNVIIAVLFIAVCFLLYPKIFSKDKFENIREEDGRISIAVMPFLNMTNDTLWDVWQGGIQNELISNLSNSTELSVRQYQTMQEVLQNADQTNYASFTPSVASDISRKLDANTFIQGSIKSAGKEIRLNAQLIDANSEEIFKTFQIAGTSEEDIFIITDSLSRLVRNYLEIKVLEQDVEYDLRTGFTTNSAEAYRYYIRGLNSYFTNHHKSALERLSQAVNIDPNFFAAIHWLIAVYESHGLTQQDYSQIEQAKQLLDRLLNWDVDKLSRMEQLSLQLIISKYVDKNPQDYIHYCKLILEYDPQQRIIWHNLGSAYSSIHQFEQAIEAYKQALEISNQWEVSDKWIWTYTNLGQAYHQIGNHEKEQEIYELGLIHFPDNSDIRRNQVKCALSLGDTTDAFEYYAKYKSVRQAELFWTDAEVMHRFAHMNSDASLLDKAEEIWRKTIQLEPQKTYHERCFAEFLILNDINIEEGLELVNGILELNPDYYDILFFKGLGLHKLGQLEEALKILQIAWNKRLTYRHDHYLAIQATEGALSGQNR